MHAAAPRFIKKLPSPSNIIIFLLGLDFAIPNAKEEARPIEPIM